MSGKAFLVIGSTGRGKSTWTRERLKKVNKNAVMIYDVNNEHSDIYDKPLLDFEDFLDVSCKVKNGVLMYEEATIFFSNKSANKKMVDILVRKRHTNNTIFLIFHSLRRVPRDIIDLCNYIVLFKTNDTPGIIESKFKGLDDIIELYNRVNNHKNFYHYEIYSLY